MRIAIAVAALMLMTGVAHAQDTGKVVIFRTFFQAGTHQAVFCDGKEIGKLGHNQYVEVSLPVGHHYCTAYKAEGTVGQAFDVKVGDTLYFSIAEAIWTGQAKREGERLTPVPVEAWQAISSQVHPA